MEKTETVGKSDEVENAETCQGCGNEYVTIWLKEGEDYNDFYLRYCPFCGQCTDQLTGSIVM